MVVQQELPSRISAVPMDGGSGKERRAWDDEPENTTDMVEEEERRPFSTRSNRGRLVVQRQSMGTHKDIAY